MVKFKLNDIIEEIASKLDTTYHKEDTISNSYEYTLPNIEESQLLEIGFIFEGNSLVTELPIYRYENLQAHFDDTLLHIYQVGE